MQELLLLWPAVTHALFFTAPSDFGEHSLALAGSNPQGRQVTQVQLEAIISPEQGWVQAWMLTQARPMRLKLGLFLGQLGRTGSLPVAAGSGLCHHVGTACRRTPTENNTVTEVT